MISRLPPAEWESADTKHGPAPESIAPSGPEDRAGADALLVIMVGGTWLRAAWQRLDSDWSDCGFITERLWLNSIQDMIEFIDCAVQLVGSQHMAAIVVGFPGRVDTSSGRVILPGYGILRSYPLREYLMRRFGKPVIIENDVNLQALGECRIRENNVASLTLVVIGTGIGSGHVIGGNLVRGAGLIAGEVGFLEAHYDGKPWTIRELCSGEAVRFFGFGHEFNAEVLRRLVAGLSVVVKTIALVVDPELIVLSGGVMEAYGATVIEQIQLGFQAYRGTLVAPRLRKLSLEMSTAGHKAAIAGALALYAKEVGR